MEADGRFDSGKCGKGLIFIITIGPTDRFIEYKDVSIQHVFFYFFYGIIEDRFTTGEYKYL